MSHAPLIMLVEDEARMRRFLRTLLDGSDYRVIEATNGSEALAMASSHNPDVIFLDLGLPDIDGLEVTRRLREWTSTPIIIISARGHETDKVKALDLGADDYLTKPFGADELLARLRVTLRHVAQTHPIQGDSFEVGDLKVDFEARRVFVNDEEIQLTPLEYRLLTTLSRNAGRVMTHRQILREVWGENQTQQTHYVRVYMAHLRRKIESEPSRPRYLITEVGVGYRMQTDDDLELN